MPEPIITICPKCKRPWNSSVDGLLELFNHQEVHRWMEADFRGTSNWTIRQTYIPEDQMREIMLTWALAEAIKICQSMGEPPSARLIELSIRQLEK